MLEIAVDGADHDATLERGQSASTATASNPRRVDQQLREPRGCPARLDSQGDIHDRMRRHRDRATRPGAWVSRCAGSAMGMAALVVIGYDGSADAERAVDLAAGLLRADAALVVNVWSPPVAAAEVPVPAGAPPPPDADEQLERAARAVAERGADRARAAGLRAEPLVGRGASPAEIATLLIDLAEERDATLVVVGRRGMSRLKEVVLGSVSNAAIHDGRRPVLVVP
jgi:nucleotide-binding universal stress UspA family protein